MVYGGFWIFQTMRSRGGGGSPAADARRPPILLPYQAESERHHRGIGETSVSLRAKLFLDQSLYSSIPNVMLPTPDGTHGLFLKHHISRVFNRQAVRQAHGRSPSPPSFPDVVSSQAETSNLLVLATFPFRIIVLFSVFLFQ